MHMIGEKIYYTVVLMRYFLWLFFAGTQLVIVLLVIDMVVLIVILKMVMAKTEAMIGMVEQEVAVIDMEGEARQETRVVTVAGRALMTAQVGEGARLPLTATNV